MLSSRSTESFRDLLLRHRGRSGLTQRELAERVGVHRRSVQEWETGVTHPSSERLGTLVRVLLDTEGFTRGHEEAEAGALWAAVVRDAPHSHAPFDPGWFATLLTPRAVRADAAPTRPTMAPATALDSGERRQDWGEAPDLAVFVGRGEELETLRGWLIEDGCRVLALLGMGGIGKTSLAAKLAYDVAPSFERVYWRSLRDAPPCDEWLGGAIGFLSDQQVVPPASEAERLAALLSLLRQRRCLLVLDNFESLFEPGRSEGDYRAGLGGYARLLQGVGETTHQSCLLLTTRESPPGLTALIGHTVRAIHLRGFDVGLARELLADKRLSGTSEQWTQLIARFGGNGLALKLVGETVRELFGGELAEFLGESGSSSMFGDMRRLLSSQVDRCSAPERQLLRALAIVREPLTLKQLLTFPTNRLDHGTILEAIEALRRRSLVERAPTPGVVAFTLQSMVLEYVTDRLAKDIVDEIRRGQPALLVEQPVIQAQAPDYVRLTQERLIGRYILQELARDAEMAHVETLLVALLDGWRGLPEVVQGFGPGNIVNLLRLQRRELRGMDLSRLAIRQAYLADVEAQDARLTDARLSETVLAEAFNFPTCVALSADCLLMAAGTSAGAVHMWRVADRTPLLLVEHSHTAGVRCIALASDGQLLISGGTDAKIRLWDTRTGRQLGILEGHTDAVRGVALSMDSRLLASGSEDGSVRLWDVTSSQLVATLRCSDGPVSDVALSGDGRLLATGGADGVVRLWDLTGGQGQLLANWQAHQSQIYAVSLSKDGRLLASSSQDGTIQLTQTPGGEPSMTLPGHEGGAFGVALVDDGRLLASGGGDGTVRLWETRSGSPLATLLGHVGIVYSVALSSAGYLLSGGGEGSVRLWQATSGEWRPVATLEGHTGGVWCTAMAADGQVLASGHADGAVRVWHVNSGEQVATLQGHPGGVWGVAISADGRLLASGGGDGSLLLWETRTWRQIATVAGHRGGVRAVCLSGDGRLLVSGGGEGSVQMWDTGVGRRLTTLTGDTGTVWSVALSADGRLLASGGGETLVRLWEPSTGRLVATLAGHAGGVRAVCLSADGHLLASGGGDGSVRLWEPSTGKLLATLSGHSGGARGVALSADGRLLASGGGDGLVRLWETSTGRLLATLTGHTGGVRGIALSADGHLLASGSLDQTIGVWDTRHGTRLHTLRTAHRYQRLDITGLTGVTDVQRRTLLMLGGHYAARLTDSALERNSTSSSAPVPPQASQRSGISGV